MTPKLPALVAAQADHDSVVELTQRLVRIPSRGGIDSYPPVVEAVESWLSAAQLQPRRLTDADGLVVGVACDIVGARPGPRYVLDACLDTAPFGDESVWTDSPTSAVIRDGWLYGRGAADSKSGVAMFCHVGARLARQADELRGTATLLFDVDEHTGRFGGAREYFTGSEAPDDVAGVYIGYPGPDEVVIGGRGVLRCRLGINGIAGHSGSSRETPNAIHKAAELVGLLRASPLPTATNSDFPLPPKVTITEIAGGEGFSMTPDACQVSVDLRLTPTFDAAAARRLVGTAIERVDRTWPTTRPTSTEFVTEWPAFHLASTAPLVEALVDGASAAGLSPRLKVAGPSNIGNYLAGLGIPATAGFGPSYQGLHGTDERIRLDSLPAVQAAYHQALVALLG